MDERYRELCVLLMRIGRIHHRIIDARIQRLGIHPSQHFLLVQLKKRDCGVSQAKLAEELDVSPALVARTLKNLELGGYICRTDSSIDGRRNEISITARGEEVLEAGRCVFDQVDAGSFAGFSDADLADFGALLNRLLNNMSGMEQAEKEEMKRN